MMECDAYASSNQVMGGEGGAIYATIDSKKETERKKNNPYKMSIYEDI